MPFPPPSRRYDDQLFSYDVEMSERLMRMRRAPCLDRGERAADVPLRLGIGMRVNDLAVGRDDIARPTGDLARGSEGHTSELHSLMRISYAVLCLNTKKNKQNVQAI